MFKVAHFCLIFDCDPLYCFAVEVFTRKTSINTNSGGKVSCGERRDGRGHTEAVCFCSFLSFSFTSSFLSHLLLPCNFLPNSFIAPFLSSIVIPSFLSPNIISLNFTLLLADEGNRGLTLIPLTIPSLLSLFPLYVFLAHKIYFL